MEDVSRSKQAEIADGTLTKKKKRRYFFGEDFQSSWLAYRDANTEEIAEKPGDDGEELDTKESSKKSRWLKKFKNIFKREVRLGEVKDSTRTEGITGSSEDFVTRTRVPFESNSKEIDNRQQLVSEEVPAKPKTERRDGELIIRHDEDEPQEEDSLPEPVSPAEALDYIDYFGVSQEIQAEENETPQLSQSGAADIVGGASTTEPIAINTKQLERTVDWNERYHKRQERRLKRKTRDLKSQDRKLKREQEHLRHRQDQVEQKINKASDSPFVEQLPPRPEKTDARLEYEDMRQKNSFIEKKTHDTIETSAVRTDVEDIPDHVLSPEIIPEKSPESQSMQAIRERVEKAADHNLPIEKIYEHRHEIKDEAGQRSGFAATQTYVAAGAGPIESPEYHVPAQPQNWTAPAYQHPFKQSANQDTDLYKRAARDGFITGVVILALILVIGLVR